MEREPQVNTLQELSNSLLIKGHGEDYIEAEEKVHVIEKKLKQLLEQVSQDLMSLQGSQVSPLVAFKYVWYQMPTGKQNGRPRCGAQAISTWSEWRLESRPFYLGGLKKLHQLFDTVLSFTRGRQQYGTYLFVWLACEKPV